ncbi:C2H2 finger domain transcription factor sebA [Trichoderma lentiforme]|uniref:C2H2 finger domain transcription factor sebA n=1 Tax=Trichoderma lentiforme TaxID=1567552 RepID=A0A9P5CAG6_9HYPO|nr:C2H2 finger domain transcription factor sebA [Trichoderma lentiforme]
MSLPIHYDEDIPGDVGSDKNGSDGSQPRSRSTINLLDDEDIFVIQSADDGNLDDIAEPSTAVDAATSDEEDVMDMLFQQDNNHIDLVQRSEHFKVNEAEIISPEPSDGQNGTESNIQLENETSQLTQEPIQRMIADATSIPTSTSVIAPALTSSSHPPVSEQQSLASQQSEKSKLLYPKLDALRKARGLDPLESTRLRRGVLDVDSDDTDMWNPQQEQTHAPDEEDSSNIAGPLNEQDMVPNKSQCWECQRRGTLCDGKIPICDNCSDAGMVCPGYNDARPLTWLPTSKVSRLQKAESESGPSSNRSDLGKSDIGNRYPLSSFQRIWDGVVGDDPRAEALRESTIPQQMHKPTPGQLQQIVYQYLVQNTSPMNDINWQSRYSVNQRMGKTLDLRQANERYLQNNTGTNTQAQAQAHGQAQVQVETQAYVPAQFRQAQAQQAQAQMGRGKVTSQNLFTNTSSTPVTSSDNISPKVPLGVDQAAAKFVDKEVHRGVPNPHNATIDDMLADLTPEQRQSILELPKETLDGVWRRWQSNRQHLMQAMNRNSRIQPQMASQPQSMPQKNAAGVSNQQQPQAERIDVNNQSPVDESMVGYTEDLNEDASSTVDVESNRRFNSMHELLTEHIKEKDRMLEVARGELEETQPESIRRFQYQHNRSRRSRSPPFDIDKRMVSYVEDVDEDAGSITGVESTRRYARSSLPRSSEPSNIGKTRMPESGIGDEIASSISSPSPYFDGTPAPYRDHHRDPQDSREPRARAPLDPAVLTWPSEDDHGEGNHKKSQLRLKNGGSRDSRDLKDLSNPRGPKKAQRDSTKHATTQPVISQSNHRRGQFEDPAAYGVQQSQQLQQAAASGRPRAKSRPASYYAAQPPRPPLDMGWPGPYAPLPPPPGAFGMRPDPFFGGPWPTEPSEALQVSDQEMMHIRNQKSVSIMNAAASGFQSGNEQIVVTEAASAASDSEASFANPEPSSSMPTSTNRSDRKQPLAEDPSWTIICDLCNRRFLHHKSLNRHYWSVHTQEEFFECSECGRMFPHRDDLAQHARIHTGGAIVKNRIEDPTP